MKKIIMIFTALILCVACTKESDKNEYCETNINEFIGYDRVMLQNKLIEYGKAAFEKMDTSKNEEQYMTHIISLETLKDYFKYDVSMFYNNKTKKECDLKKTKMEIFIVRENDNVSYDYTPYLYCD